MNLDEPDIWLAVADVAAAVFLLLGAFLTFSAGVGVLRFPNLLARMHAVTKPQVLGLILMLMGVALRLRSWPAVTMLALVVVFQLLTSPVAAHMVGRAGLRTRKVSPEELDVDDYTDKTD
jgi:multicomponent Na+:H+ antiporter subunit G